MGRMPLAIVALALCSCSIDPKDLCMSAIDAEYATGKYGKPDDGERFSLRYEVETTPGKTHTYYVEIHDFAGYWFDGWKVDFTAPADYDATYLGRFQPIYRPV